MKKMRMPRVKTLYDRVYDRRQRVKFDDWLLLERDYDPDVGRHWQVYHQGALVYDGSMQDCQAFVDLNKEPQHAEPVIRGMR